MDSDWTSIEVEDTKPEDIELFLKNHVQLSRTAKGLFEFSNSNVTVYFYKNSEQHFDFDPRNVKSMEQWEKFLVIFMNISKAFKKDVLFRPEDNKGDLDSVIVRVTDNLVGYNFEIRDKYKD